MPTPPTSTTAASGASAATVPLTKAIMPYGLSTGSCAWACVPGDGLLESVLGGGAPDVADGEREGVGGVGRLGGRVEPQQPGDHGADLCLVGAAAAGDGGLDLAGGVQGDGDAAAGGAEHGDGAGLGGAHHGADVVLAEHPLHGDALGPVLVQPLLDALLDGDEAVPRARRPRACVRRRRRPCVSGRPGDALDDADAAPRQSGVHPQYAHAPPPLAPFRAGSRAVTDGRLSGCHRQRGGPTGRVPPARRDAVRGRLRRRPSP